MRLVDGSIAAARPTLPVGVGVGVGVGVDFDFDRESTVCRTIPADSRLYTAQIYRSGLGHGPFTNVNGRKLVEVEFGTA